MQVQVLKRTPAGSLQRPTPDATRRRRERPVERPVDQTTLIERCVDVIVRLHTLEPPAAAGPPKPGHRAGLLAEPLRVLASGHPLAAVTEPDVDADGSDVTGSTERGGNLAAVIIEATGGPGGDLRPQAAYDATLRAVACRRAGLREDTPAAAFNWTGDGGPAAAREDEDAQSPRSAATAALARLLTRWSSKGRARPGSAA